jgi:hypothetical protein
MVRGIFVGSELKANFRLRDAQAAAAPWIRVRKYLNFKMLRSLPREEF